MRRDSFGLLFGLLQGVERLIFLEVSFRGKEDFGIHFVEFWFCRQNWVSFGGFVKRVRERAVRDDEAFRCVTECSIHRFVACFLGILLYCEPVGADRLRTSSTKGTA